MKKIKALAQSSTLDNLKLNMSVKKKVIIEYEISIKYMIQGKENKFVLWVLGPNYRDKEIIENVHQDATKMENITGFMVPEAKNIRLLNLIEEEGSLIAETKVNP